MINNYLKYDIIQLILNEINLIIDDNILFSVILDSKYDLAKIILTKYHDNYKDITYNDFLEQFCSRID